MPSDNDFIRDLIETRQVADSFAEKLIQNKEMDDENDVEAES